MDNTVDLQVGAANSDDAFGTDVVILPGWNGTENQLAASAVWNDAGQIISDPMREGAYGAVFVFQETAQRTHCSTKLLTFRAWICLGIEIKWTAFKNYILH